MYEYICEHVKQAEVFDDVFIDTNSEEVAEYANKMGFRVIERKPELAKNTANGNDLLVYHFEQYPEYDYYFQAFATAPYMQADTIKKCYGRLIYSEEFDSCFTATENHGFYWLSDNPINYRPDTSKKSGHASCNRRNNRVIWNIKRFFKKIIDVELGKNHIYILLVSLRPLILIQRKI